MKDGIPQSLGSKAAFMLDRIKAGAWTTVLRPRHVITRNLKANLNAAREGVAAFAWGLRLILTGSALPRMLIYFGQSPGDDLLCTAVFRELKKRRGPVAMMISNYPELFIGNGDVAYVRPAGIPPRKDASAVQSYSKFARIWGADFRSPVYSSFDHKDQSESPTQHIIAEMCARSGIKGTILVRPYLLLTGLEKSEAQWANGRIVIQSSGLGARHPMRNKQWFEERFQAVVDALSGEFQFIQLGAVSDPPLRQVYDLRGKTDIRKSAAILSHARLYVGTVGFLMHLARAVECPSVVVYGGREAPWQSGYICNVNLYSSVSCAPCWRWNLCDFDRRCMDMIAVDDVLSAVRQLLNKPRGPLDVESIEVA